MGKPVAFFDKYSRGSKDYFTLAKELIFLTKQEDEQEDTFESESAPQIDQKEVKKSILNSFSQRMKKIVKEETRELFPTRFSIDVSGAKSVYVTGSFNDWSLDDSCRLKEADGQWRVEIPLKPGLYKYQFIVDGVWKEDPDNPRRERNSFGDINSLVEVKAPVSAGDNN